MAEISITNTAVLATSDTIKKDAIAGETIAAGKWIYIDAADNNEAKLAQNDSTAAQADAVGIALNGASAGQPVQYAIAGNVTVDNTTADKFYFLSSTAGNMELESDLASSERIVLLCYATSATNIKLAINNTGLTV